MGIFTPLERNKERKIKRERREKKGEGRR